MPAPLPARLADWVASALANSTSWRINVDKSEVISEINSPNDRGDSGAGACIGELADG